MDEPDALKEVAQSVEAELDRIEEAALRRRSRPPSRSPSSTTARLSTSTSAERLVEIGMPRLSDSMEEATILSWLKRPGDDVARGEGLVEVETDKATMVYEAEIDGVLEEIVVDDGATAALGAVIARIRIGADGAPRGPPPPPRPPASTPSSGAKGGDGRARVP